MKAKDLRGRNVEDVDPDSEGQESSSTSDAKAMPDKSADKQEDQVTAAYENISRKLDSIRSGKSAEESDDPEESKDEEKEEPELEEWKGPKPPSKDLHPKEEDEDNLRKVKLRNLEDTKEEREELDKEEADTEEEVSQKDVEEAKEEEEVPRVPQAEEEEEKKVWEPKENDPLDDDEGAGDEQKEDIDLSRSRGPDTLDDLADERKPVSEDEAEEFEIPNLKGSGQRAGNLSYNTPPQREGLGQSYSPKGYMDNNDPNNFFSSHQQPQVPKRANKFHLLILVIIGVAVIGFTIYILKGGFGDINFNASSSPSPTPAVETPAPTPTPTPEPDRAKYKIRVLNGSGKTGLAKTVADKLKELGYQVDKTGNATNSAFTQTIVRVKSDAESFIPQIVKDLAPEFDAAGNTTLKDADAVDIEVILGAK